MTKNHKVECKDINGNKFNVPENELTFRPSVYGVVLKDKKILLSKQWGGYDLPGGGIGVGEKIEDALKREVFEETGIKVKVERLITCKDSFFRMPAPRNNYVHAILIYFECKVVGGKLSKKNLTMFEQEFADAPEWVDLKNINKIKFCSTTTNPKILGLTEEGFKQ
ncbi:MAG: NUDIX domain-containing protein [Candidatus Magasanikbacteria bacterium]|jgi:ADP-ribose pyrophosphatase YjhB (NUDIX family)